MTLTPTNDAELARDLLEKITRSDHGKHSMKVKTLMASFGFSAEHRVRQASLDGVIDRLEAQGITCVFPSEGRSANDWVTMSRLAVTAGTPLAAPKDATAAHPVADAAVVASGSSVDATFNPLNLAFTFGDGASEAQSHALAEQILSQVWAFRPICLAIEGEDADLAFAGAVLGAVMRRRFLFLGREAGQDARATSPEILTMPTLEMLAGHTWSPNGSATMSAFGGNVLLVRIKDDARADELVAFLRDVFAPHTYRAVSRAPESLRTFSDWLAAFAGSPTLAEEFLNRCVRENRGDAGRRRIDLAAMVTAASQLRDVHFERGIEGGIDPAFKAGFESSEHMVLKAAVQRYLRKLHGAAAVRMEETYDPDDATEETPPGDDAPSPLTCRPDLRVEGKVWVEVETLRGRGMRMRDPFFELERSMLRRIVSAKPGEELWMLVPNDLALLASRKLEVLASNLRAVRKDVPVRWGFVDLRHDQPVFLSGPTGLEEMRVESSGRSWRERRVATATPLGWRDVAGYSDVKRHLGEDVLDPLKNPTKYRNHGLTSANGLLLYGLPGCGKSLMGRVLAGEAGVACKVLLPSDLTSMWIGEGVGKTRAVFDWALEQEGGCLLVLDELDAVAPRRSEANMHSDEKRQVNELLVQLDRIAKKPINRRRYDELRRRHRRRDPTERSLRREGAGVSPRPRRQARDIPALRERSEGLRCVRRRGVARLTGGQNAPLRAGRHRSRGEPCRTSRRPRRRGERHSSSHGSGPPANHGRTPAVDPARRSARLDSRGPV